MGMNDFIGASQLTRMAARNAGRMVLCGLFLVVALIPQTVEANDLSCHEGTKILEQVSGIPPHLLTAIALAESGRRLPGKSASSAWPWTVMAEGRGRYLPSKAAAIAEVEALRARGITNIDVGCMQINLHYHANAFLSLEEAFDPLANVAYAAAFLTDLRVEARSWTMAVGLYHSRDRERSGVYRHKVLKFWRDEQRRASRERRAVKKADPEKPRAKS